MESRQHKIVIEFIRNTDELVTFARANQPGLDDSAALQALAMKELENVKSELFEFDSAQIVGFSEDPKALAKKEHAASKFVFGCKELVKMILSSNTLTEEIRRIGVELLEESYPLGSPTRTIYTPSGLKASITKEDYDVITETMKDGRKITAIVMVRNLTKWGLKDAKECVDEWERYGQNQEKIQYI